MNKKFTKEDLLPFCADPYNEPLRPWLKEPWINEQTGDVWASEGHYALILKRPLASGRFKKYHYGNNIKITQEDMRVKIDFADIGAAYDKVEKYVETTKVTLDEVDECLDCGGTGEVDWEYTDLDGNTHYMSEECPVCHGEKQVNVVIEKPTGRMLPKPQQIFRLHRVLLDVRNFMYVVTTLRDLGFSQLVWMHEDPKDANLFEVAEGITLMIMPLLGDGKSEDEIIDIEVKEITEQ